MTSFPNSTDSFTTFLDIVASDGPYIKQYIEAMNNSDQVTASQILAQIPSATQKIVKATDLNKLSQAVLALERFWNSDIKNYLVQLQAEWVDYINQFEYLGTWSNTRGYVKNNLVAYQVEGQTYVYLAIDNVPQGVRPTNANYWQVLTVKGVEGPAGEGMAFIGNWASANNYKLNDAVSYNNSIWRSLKTNNNVQPGTDSTTWEKILTGGVTAYPVQSTQPTTQNEGELWFDTSVSQFDYYKLTTLTNPATASQIKSGYRAYDSTGNVIVGTMA